MHKNNLKTVMKLNAEFPPLKGGQKNLNLDD
jgi:hypothetical protein